MIITTGTLAILLFMLFCYSVITTGSLASYFAIYAILLFHGLPGTGTLAILLLILCMLFCYFVVYLGDACYFAIL